MHALSEFVNKVSGWTDGVVVLLDQEPGSVANSLIGLRTLGVRDPDFVKGMYGIAAVGDLDILNDFGIRGDVGPDGESWVDYLLGGSWKDLINRLAQQLNSPEWATINLVEAGISDSFDIFLRCPLSTPGAFLMLAAKETSFTPSKMLGFGEMISGIEDMYNSARNRFPTFNFLEGRNY